jgi:hypothetical protein
LTTRAEVHPHLSRATMGVDVNGKSRNPRKRSGPPKNVAPPARHKIPEFPFGFGELQNRIGRIGLRAKITINELLLPLTLI